MNLPHVSAQPAGIKILRRLHRYILCVLLVTGGCAVVSYVAGYRTLVVLSGSMSPELRAGDLVVIHNTSPQHVSPGQIVSYRSTADPSVTITHRLIGIDIKRGIMRTKGDSLATADTDITTRQLRGRAVAVLPQFGRFLYSLQRPAVLMLAVYMPAGALGALEALRLAALFKPPHTYRAAGYG